ncbi:MAG: NAD(P)/FAD-dependent oxidoreductase [Ruminococcus sp.]|nr:NAD(P)/FAD-dependent oxidoreductase [Ruminococcus sp.]
MPWNTSDEDIIKDCLKKSGLTHADVFSASIYKAAVDARKQQSIKKVCSVLIDAGEVVEQGLLNRGAKRVAGAVTLSVGGCRKDEKVVIVGFGPAGMFSGLLLAENGFKPLIIERGEAVENRAEAIKRFFSGGELNENSNVQFGEGGAGTFSDGKLTTRIGDSRVRFILETFVKYGAPEEILRQAKPHIGTDNLQKIVRRIRERICELGGEVRFNTRLVDINIRGGRVVSIKTDDTEIECDKLILAIGHSAHDTVKMLLSKRVNITSKPFSVGVRIEHKQDDIDASLYGEKRHKYRNLPVGEYQLSKRFPDGRAVYTFCMCPGGKVVASSSERETIVTNGMSLYARDGENANSALCVSVSAEDFGGGPLDGMEFARKIERAAFNVDYCAPACSTRGFLSDKPSLADINVTPSYKPGVREADFREIFPGFVIDTLKIGLNDFSRKLRAFGSGKAVLTAPETRTSSPVRILRNDGFSSVTLKNLYPCGEGAGYAGGIVSSAADGLRTAENIIGGNTE